MSPLGKLKAEAQQLTQVGKRQIDLYRRLRKTNPFDGMPALREMRKIHRMAIALDHEIKAIGGRVPSPNLMNAFVEQNAVELEIHGPPNAAETLRNSATEVSKQALTMTEAINGLFRSIRSGAVLTAIVTRDKAIKNQMATYEKRLNRLSHAITAGITVTAIWLINEILMFRVPNMVFYLCLLGVLDIGLYHGLNIIRLRHEIKRQAYKLSLIHPRAKALETKNPSAS